MNESIFYAAIRLMAFSLAVFFCGSGLDGANAFENDARRVGPPVVRPSAPVGQRSPVLPEPRNSGWRERVMTEQELERVGDRDWDLSPSIARRILARLNVRDPDYIEEDIRAGRSLKVPNDFSRFKSWTPLQHYIPEAAEIPKLILIVADIPFLGWYEYGRLVGDSYTCIGKQGYATQTGIFTVKEKDIDHISRSYPNAYGAPAPMPWALRVYETVWIHAGDITGGYCSHGCINIPIFPAIKLFEWAALGAPVLIVDSVAEVSAVLRTNGSNCSLYAARCASGRAG